jgi:hypothetical protein
VKITVPFNVKLPAAPKAVITPISLLTVPAARDPVVVRKLGDLASVPSGLWDHVYGLYGYDAANMKVSMAREACEQQQCA